MQECYLPNLALRHTISATEALTFAAWQLPRKSVLSNLNPGLPLFFLLSDISQRALDSELDF